MVHYTLILEGKYRLSIGRLSVRHTCDRAQQKKSQTFWFTQTFSNWKLIDSYFNPQALVSGKKNYLAILGIFLLPETSACASISICAFPLFHTQYGNAHVLICIYSTVNYMVHYTLILEGKYRLSIGRLSFAHTCDRAQ
jgi:hypothetical protein